MEGRLGRRLHRKGDERRGQGRAEEGGIGQRLRFRREKRAEEGGRGQRIRFGREKRAEEAEGG